MAFINKNVKLIIFISIFLSGCKMKAEKSKSENYVVYVDQIINTFAEETKKEFGLICIGDGGKMPYDVEEISVEFLAYQKASIEEARKLEVEVTERFLKAINSHEKIRPFLREYPFKANRARVAISFNRPDNTPYTDGSVSYVFQVKNKIHYYKGNASSSDLISLKEEPYEEALKITQNSSHSQLSPKKEEI